MEIKSRDYSTNFGWFYGTHKRVTRFALKNLSNLKKHNDALEEFSQAPDFDETGFYNNWHFYAPDKKRSFMDYNGKNNALAKYKEHISKMLLAVDEMKEKVYIEHAGRAIHYLQDATQPLHAQKGFIFNKILYLKTHLAFEECVKKNQQECFSNYVEKPFTNKSFEQLFLDNIQLSAKSELPTGDKRYLWERIGRDGVNQAIISTREFLVKLNLLIDKNPQLKLPFK